MTRSTAARRARTTASLIAAAILIAVWAVTLRPQSLGGPVLYVVVRGTSMLPTYQGGDLVLVRAEPAYRVGDAVAYRVPKWDFGAGGVLIHRIAGGDGTAGYEMRGDNNSAPDPWTPRTGDIAGKAWLSVPGIGGLIAVIRQPTVIGALAAAIVVAVILTRQPAPANSGAGSNSGSRWVRRRSRPTGGAQLH